MNVQYPGRGQVGGDPLSLEALLLSIAETLDVPRSAYEQAVERYEAVGDWLCREGSSLERQQPVVYPQGSVSLGTIVRPLSGDDYDVDAVVQLTGPQDAWDPAELKNAVGLRLRESGVYRPMLEPEGRRCWTLRYSAQGAAHGFHLDLLPSVPAGASIGASTAIAITNRAGGTVEWRPSDPKAYATWFRRRMVPITKRRVLDEKVAGVEPVPHYSERVPLQYVVQFLKRYRDLLFVADNEHAPISVVITTLCAHAYEGEDTLQEAFLGVLDRLPKFIDRDGKRLVIRNPVSPEENFADRWEGNPEKQEAFLRWLNAVERLRYELPALAPDKLGPVLKNVLGESSTRTALEKYASKRDAARARSVVQSPSQLSSSTMSTLAGLAGNVLTGWRRLLEDALHRQQPRWPFALDGTSLVVRGSVVDSRGAFRGGLASGDAVSVGDSIRFEAVGASLGTELFWQVTNTGDEAKRSHDLRGGFENGTSVKRETARYRGMHFVECFSVRAGKCVARSGEFAVSIQ